MIRDTYVGLRAIETEDLPQLMAWRNKPELRQYFRETNEINMFKQKQWFEMINKKESLHKMFAIVKLDSNELMGVCGLCYIDWINSSADFSIYLGYDNLYIDDLYALEAAKLMREYAFQTLNIHRLWAEIYDIDTKKKRFFHTLGFTHDGTLRDTYWHENSWHNSLFYSFLSTDETD